MNYEQEQEVGLHFLDYWRVIRSRKEIVLAVTILVAITGALATFLMDPLYQAEARILVNQDALDVDVFERNLTGRGYNPFFLRTQFEVLQSKPVLYKVISDLSLTEKWSGESNEADSPLTREQALQKLKNNLTVEQYRDTSLIAIRVASKEPEETARIANQIAEVYREDRLSRKRLEAERGINALKDQLEKQSHNVSKAEKELEGIREKFGVTFLERGIKLDTARLQKLEGDRISARVDMLERKARLDQLIDLSGQELMNSASYIVFDETVQMIRQQLTDTSVQLDLMLVNLGENHPNVRQARAAQSKLAKELEATLAGLKAGLKADYEVSKAKYKTLEEELDSARKQDIDSRDRHLPFDKAERELDVQRHILQAVQSRVAQVGIEIEVPRTPVEIIDYAEPPKDPFSPNLVLNILVSLFLGGISGIGLAYFIEYLDTSVKTVDDVERHLQLPVLGVIPQKVRPLIEEGPDSSHAEAYRVLRTNMLFNKKGISGGAFAVMSGGVGEGKSTTLFNLAYVCAQMGDKVLIVDSDLRRPVQHSILNMSNRKGLTNILMGNSDIEGAIEATSLPNLHFLPSGRMPRSALGILDSQRMRDLVKDLKARYDYVFFDSPPIVGVSDASILSSEVDGVLLVVQYRKYPRVMSARAKRMVDNVGGNLLGVVLNNINILRDDYYYYYHSYYTHYHQESEEMTQESSKTAMAAGEGDDRL